MKKSTIIILLSITIIGSLVLIISKPSLHKSEHSGGMCELLELTKKTESSMNEIILEEAIISNILNILKSDPSLINKNENGLNNLIAMKNSLTNFLEFHLAAENNTKEILLKLNAKLESNKNDHYSIANITENIEKNERLYELSLDLTKKIKDHLDTLDSLITLSKENPQDLPQE